MRHSLPQKSLLAWLVGAVAVALVVVVTVFTSYRYEALKQKITQDTQQQAVVAVTRLQVNIAPLAEAYAVNEYTKLVANEIELQHFYAIVVEDYNLGRTLGQRAFVSGRIDQGKGQYRDVEAIDPGTQSLLDRSYFKASAALLSSTDETIGRVSVYMTDQALQHELARLLQDSVGLAVFAVLLLTALLVLFVHRLFMQPMHRITQAIAQRDADGIPVSTAPTMEFREFAVLTETINAMLAVIKRSRDSLHLERQRLQGILEGTNVGTWEWNVQTGESTVNARWANMIGYTLEELQPVSVATWLTRLHPQDLEQSQQLLDQHFRGELPFYECEARIRHKNGHWVWVLDRGKVASWTDDGKPLLMSGTHQEITGRKLAEEKIRLAAKVFTHAREGITITDIDANVIEVNQAFTDITGYEREEVLGKNPRVFSSGRQDKAFYITMWEKILSDGYWSGEIWNRRKDGKVIAELLTISAVRDERGDVQNYIGLFSDITESKEHQARLEHIAHYDALSGLPNRLLLGDRLRQGLAQAARRGQHLAVVYLDLDGFKSVNDTHGHAVGDQLLVALATNISDALREGDTLARIGGDEFVAVLVDMLDSASCIPVLQRMLEAAAQTVNIGELSLRVTASIGVSLFPQAETMDSDQLIRQADQAMYQAKLSGKNHFHFFDAEHDRNIRGQHESIGNIRNALAKGEFVLAYQPKIDLRTGVTVGAEALIRWQHPQQGLLYPAQFIPVLENHPLSIEMGEWVLDTALTHFTGWKAQGLSIPVSVNIGALQLQHPDFTARLRDLLQRHPRVRPGDLELEILETSALQDFTLIKQVIAECMELGVGFAIDDFGTGYSSLTYLKQLPAPVLKIDQSFVRDMLDDPDDLSILKGILGLASAFDRKAIAEGIETPEHGEMLLRLGCFWGQGYAIARPMPPHELPTWVRHWRAPPSWQT